MPVHSIAGRPILIRVRWKMFEIDSATTPLMPASFSDLGACSSLAPMPKKRPAIRMSPGFTLFLNSGSTPPITFSILPLSIESPNFQIRPLIVSELMRSRKFPRVGDFARDGRGRDGRRVAEKDAGFFRAHSAAIIPVAGRDADFAGRKRLPHAEARSEEHTSDLQSHSFISYAV